MQDKALPGLKVLLLGAKALLKMHQPYLAQRALIGVTEIVDKHSLGERSSPYKLVSDAENISLRLDNRFFRIVY